MKTKNFFTKKDNNSEKGRIVVGTIGGIGFLICSVLVLNIFENPILENKNISNSDKNFLEEAEIFHGSSDKFFSGKQEIKKNFYLINFVEQISKIYEENGKISYKDSQEKELFLREVAKKYTLENIEDFRRASTAEENVEQFSWRLLNKTIPVGFEINMEELEWIFVGNIK